VVNSKTVDTLVDKRTVIAAIEDVPAEVEEGSTAEHASVRIVSG
jgi:hypothetical protein